MALKWFHNFVSPKAEGVDSTLVGPNEWNALHSATSDEDSIVVGRGIGVGAGPLQEMPLTSFYVPTGTVWMFAGANAPAGWILCEGQTVGRTDPTFAALFAVIGGYYGAPDANTFSLPDLRGRVPAGVDYGAGRLPNWVLGTAGGAYSMQASTFGVVSVGVNGSTSGAQYFDGGDLTTGYESAGVGGLQFGGGGYAAEAHTHVFRAYGWTQGQALSVSANGSGSIVNNGQNVTSAFTIVQPTIALNYIIKL